MSSESKTLSASTHKLKKNNPTPPVLFNYLNYRDFLKDYFQYQKQNNPVFSQRNFVRAAGIPTSSNSIITSVVIGKRNLSQSYRLKFARALKLKERERTFFDYLVQFNQAKTMEEKNHFFTLISSFRGSRGSLLNVSQNKMFGQWYHTVIFNLIGAIGSVCTPEKIVKKIFPPITIKQCKDSLQLLLKLKLIHKLANGYKISETHLTTPKDVQDIFARQYIQQLMMLSYNVFEKVPQNKRHYSGFVFSISSDGFKTIRERIRSFQEELRGIIDRDTGDDRVYSLAIQLFPNTMT